MRALPPSPVSLLGGEKYPESPVQEYPGYTLVLRGFGIKRELKVVIPGFTLFAQTPDLSRMNVSISALISP